MRNPINWMATHSERVYYLSSARRLLITRFFYICCMWGFWMSVDTGFWLTLSNPTYIYFYAQFFSQSIRINLNHVISAKYSIAKSWDCNISLLHHMDFESKSNPNSDAYQNSFEVSKLVTKLVLILEFLLEFRN